MPVAVKEMQSPPRYIVPFLPERQAIRKSAVRITVVLRENAFRDQHIAVIDALIQRYHILHRFVVRIKHLVETYQLEKRQTEICVDVIIKRHATLYPVMIVPHALRFDYTFPAVAQMSVQLKKQIDVLIHQRIF